MEKDTKLYRVEIGYLSRSAGDSQNWRKVTVLAKDAFGAIKKVELSKNEYIVAAEVVDVVEIQ